MTELIRQVGASYDDIRRGLGLNYISRTLGECLVGCVAVTTNDRWGSGMRFTNITIPKGATIDGAYLTGRCSYDRDTTVVRSRISAEDVDDAPTFSIDKAVFDARWANRTTARVDWDAIPTWVKDTDYNSPEIKTTIQEIVDREGWNSGQDIVIFWEDFENRTTATNGVYRSFYSWDGSAPYAPKLTINYTVEYILHEKTLTDGIEINEALVKNPIKLLSDGVALSDVLVKNPIKLFADGIAFTDTWEGYRLITKVLSDGIAIEEALTKRIDKVISDGIKISEALERWWTQHYERVFTDGIAFTDVAFRSFTKLLTDGIAMADVLRKDIAKILVDGIAFKDILTRYFELVLTDGIKFADFLLKWRWLTPVRRLLPFRLWQPKREEEANE